MITSMNRSPKLKPSKYDALVVLAVLLLTAVLGARYWPARAEAGALTVVVTADGAEVDRFALEGAELRDAARVYENGGYLLLVAAAAEGVHVSASDCPGHDCVRTGTITRAGQSIVCLPARIVITLHGAPGTATYDAVAG